MCSIATNPALIAINCNELPHHPNPLQSISPDVGFRKYIDLAVSENTRKAYKADLAHFQAAGGTIPCSVDVLASYLANHAGMLSCATLTRRIAAISKAHNLLGIASPTASDSIRMLMRGIRRLHGKPQHQVAAMVKEDLIVVLSAIPDDLRGLRDRALLLLGFCAALRRSELCRVRYEDLQFNSEGLVLTLPRSKTDQSGEGRRIGVPYGRGKICPVQAVQNWLERAAIAYGYVFRGIERDAVVEVHLCDRSIANIIKVRAKNAGLCADSFSGHSLRSGLATSAAAEGISSWKIKAQTGHKSDAMLARYIRDGNLFRNNAAALF